MLGAGPSNCPSHKYYTFTTPGCFLRLEKIRNASSDFSLIG